MKDLTFLFILFFLISSCKDAIKNDVKIDIEEGTSLATNDDEAPKEINSEIVESNNELAEIENLKGFWVGYFEKESSGDALIVDEGYVWNRNNKINISIDRMEGNIVYGHSVVAGNDRPFKGDMKQEHDGSFSFQVKEPGDDRYDGTFNFTIKNGKLSGTWSAFKQIEIPKRKYNLEKKTFTYNPNIMLEPSRAYVDWTNKVEVKEQFVMDDNEIEEWITTQFSTATELIYSINASNKLLEKSDVDNLQKGDLTIIRNTIYARHGYSYKNRPLRVFFDAQSWYIPVHSNIKGEFTEIEKENIKLLLTYEQNAAEYYDSFGRG